MGKIDHITTDAVLVPRSVLDAIVEALASIVQVSGQSFGVLLDRLDRHDGDPDLEEDDDPGQCDEDEVNTLHSLACGGGPGCLISDSDSAVDDRPCDDIGQDREPEDGY